MKYLIALLLLAGSLVRASSTTPASNLSIEVKVGMTQLAAAGTVTLIAGTPGKTLSLKSFVVNTSTGGTCSCYDASAPATTIVPYFNQAANVLILQIANVAPGAIPVSVAGNSIKCTYTGAQTILMEAWNK